jgi:hypothetical protein
MGVAHDSGWIHLRLNRVRTLRSRRFGRATGQEPQAFRVTCSTALDTRSSRPIAVGVFDNLASRTRFGLPPAVRGNSPASALADFR